ncbi:MAG TPA: cytochrome c1 [Devosia sp.]|jgi:ubiquinol-cytochrome c reductase cytochrome c1 subunit|nr:cytochrome c1 [Devosia sp.]
MFNTKTILAAVALVAGFALPAAAAEDSHASPVIDKQNWSFAGIFGTYDEHQLQRGFQVYREVCASCHGARLVAFRNLSEPGGPGFSEEQVKALALEYEVADDTAEGGFRTAVPADRWPSPFLTEQDARDANGGSLPPDFSVLAKARGVSDPFPYWTFNYFTGYSEGGPDYIHALLTGYHDEAPAGFELPPGKYYNDVFPGHAIGMAPPLQDGIVTYVAAEGETEVPLTVDQYSKDVAAFMMWMAEPHLAGRKQTGFVVLLFLILFAGLMYATKRRIWKGIEH